MNKRKNKIPVLLNACMYTQKPTGNGVYIREVYNRLCRKLDECNIDYTCYAYSKAELDNGHKVKIIHLPFAPASGFNRLLGLHRFVWNIFVLPFIARQYGLVYSFSNHGSPFIKNQVITIHDLICLQFPKQNRLQFWYNKFFLPAVIRTSKKIITISKFTAAQVEKAYNTSHQKIEVIYNGGDHLKRPSALFGIEAKNRLEALTGHKKFYLSAGVTYPHKNADILVEAMARLKNNTMLVLTGPRNRYFLRLKQKLDAGGADNVILLDYVEPEFLQYLYSRCIANVYISLHEGFGFPPMEAAAYGKISVLSREGALPEIYDGSAYYCDAYDAGDVARALEAVAMPGFDATPLLLKNGPLHTIYTWDKTVKDILAQITGAVEAGEEERLYKTAAFG